MNARGERGAVAIAAVALLLLLALVAGAGLRAGRSLLLDERVHGSADAVALAAANVLAHRYGEAVDAGGSPAVVRATESAARAAARNAAEQLGVTLEAIAFERGAHDASPLAVRVRLVAGTDRASARAGIGFTPSLPAGGFRIADVRGLDAGGAVVAAALAQLGWPYVWGGESRAEGGFDCSGLIDYALAAAGMPVGRLTASGLQQLARALPADAALQAGDLVFVGEPAHHVGLVVAPGLAVEAPHRGARVHVESLGAGGWTGAGRLLLPATAGLPGADDLAVPAYVPASRRAVIARVAQAEQLPPALLAAQLEAESGFDASAPAIAAQARQMHELLERTDGDIASALAAYNAGPAVLPGKWARETRAYVARVMRRFGGPLTLAAALPPELAAAGAARSSATTEVRLLP